MFRRTLIALAVGLSLSAVEASAQTSAQKAVVDSAKSAGTVGEQGDGYLGMVSSAGDASIQSAVAAINAGRAKTYADIAAKSGVTPSAAGQATAQQLFERLPPHAYYKPLGGSWQRK